MTTTQHDSILLRAPSTRPGEDANESPVSPPASPSPGTFRRPRRATTKRKAASQPPVLNVAKRRVAERRRSLRNERMATIDYDELVLRLADLVESTPNIADVTLEEISKLYQVRPRPTPPSLSNRPASTHIIPPCRSRSATSCASCSR